MTKVTRTYSGSRSIQGTPVKRKALDEDTIRDDTSPTKRRRTRTTAECVEIRTPSRTLRSNQQGSKQKSTPSSEKRTHPLPSQNKSKSHPKVGPPTKKRTTRTDAAVNESPTNTGEEDDSIHSPIQKPAKRSPKRPRIRTDVEDIPSPSPSMKRSSPTLSPLDSPLTEQPSYAESASPDPLLLPPPLSQVDSLCDVSGLLRPVFYPCLRRQKQAMLRILHTASVDCSHEEDDELESANSITKRELAFLIDGTVQRGEGNSCLIVGPRASGKTKIVEDCLNNMSVKPIILRLSGWVQHTDTLAMREIARQLNRQTGETFLDVSQDTEDTESQTQEQISHSLPASFHLPNLIALFPTLKRPVIVILDRFELFTLHLRQSLLYCLFDTAQNCKSGTNGSGLAIIGTSCRIDVINALEKRVKSRFSGRIFRTACPSKLQQWQTLLDSVISTPITANSNADKEWNRLWPSNARNVLLSPEIGDILNGMFSITGDLSTLRRLITSTISQLSNSTPFPTAELWSKAAERQSSRPQFPTLASLPYPSICLLIAAQRAEISGFKFITFEMLHDIFRLQVRSSSVAPIHMNGLSIGLHKCSREILLTVFEQLVFEKMFIPVGSTLSATGKEFIKYQSAVDKLELKKAVEKRGETLLKNWLTKG